MLYPGTLNTNALRNRLHNVRASRQGYARIGSSQSEVSGLPMEMAFDFGVMRRLMSTTPGVRAIRRARQVRAMARNEAQFTLRRSR